MTHVHSEFICVRGNFGAHIDLVGNAQTLVQIFLVEKLTILIIEIGVRLYTKCLSQFSKPNSRKAENKKVLENNQLYLLRSIQQLFLLNNCREKRIKVYNSSIYVNLAT